MGSSFTGLLTLGDVPTLLLLSEGPPMFRGALIFRGTLTVGGAPDSQRPVPDAQKRGP